MVSGLRRDRRIGPVMIPALSQASCGIAQENHLASAQSLPSSTADIELTTGIVGAAGGLGGFFLSSAIGALKDISGSFGVGLLCFAFLALTGAVLLLEFGVHWSFSWTPDALRQTMVFRYRTPRRRPLQEGSLASELQPAEE